jgi:hypothetical protein
MDLFDLVSISDVADLGRCAFDLAGADPVFLGAARIKTAFAAIRPDDPFASPIGDWPNLLPMPSGSILTGPAERSPSESGTGYSARELDRFTCSARRAAPAGQGSGGDGNHLSGAAAAGPSSWRGNNVHTNFTPAEHANFLAAKVVAYATAYLDGRDDANNLGRNAACVMCELLAAPDDAPARAILWAARMLAQTMSIAAAAEGIARQDRCQHRNRMDRRDLESDPRAQLKTGKVGWHCEHATTGCEFCYAEGFNKRLGTGLPFKPGHRKDIEIFLDERC